MQKKAERMSMMNPTLRATSIARVFLSTLVAMLVPFIAHAQFETSTPPLNGIAHVAIRVHDLAASVAFYEKLGFAHAFDLRKNDLPYESFIKINDTQFIELYPVTPKDPNVGFLRICFEAADLQAINDDYLSRGLTPGAIANNGAGNLSFSLAGPEQPFGPQTIEFTQYMPDSLHSADKGRHLDSDRVADKLIAVSLAMKDTASARDFYINQLNFKSIAGDPMNMHMPGNSGQEIEIAPAALGTQARLTLNSPSLSKAARHLHKENVASVKNGETLTVTDPDGNVLLLETR
jgi:catechol 2,3-dioxygenase-like lactoylglutathione lyase family enzyme